MTIEPAARTFFAFDNSYARLPERFFARLAPTPVRAPALVRLNESLARELGLDPAVLASPEGVAVLAGNRLAEGSIPLAQAYAGHQFGGFTPQLGDGRAILLGEVIDSAGRRRDIQLKGSGPTPFSRRGDGRAALGPVLREYIVSEAMAALGLPTTRSLAAVTTGEQVLRESALPGAVLTRIAASHIRVGTFQYFAVRQDIEAIRLLAEHVIARHYPEAAAAPNPIRAFLDAVIGRQAALVARWMGIGFIHGVMNTDNTSIAGETIDYGPCAFMDAYHPSTVFSSIDQTGRYAYANQPVIAQWNLARLAETLLPLLAADTDTALAEAQAAIDGFPPRYEAAFAEVFAAKLGLTAPRQDDMALLHDLLKLMTEARADFTLTFRGLRAAAEDVAGEAALRSHLTDGDALDAWLARWRLRLAMEPADPIARRNLMARANPAIIPRNHLIEAAIAAAVGRGDYAPFHALVDALATPFDDVPADSLFAQPPRPEEVVRQTFCGT
ncbi:MAG: YdiU family protein [Hyphomicrobiaceae bacterium]|nr:YdiU family protein [Hyphomicrobiaceae bacterium]